MVEKVTVEDLNRVGDVYVTKLFDPTKMKAVILCDGSRTEEIKKEFETYVTDLFQPIKEII